MTTLRTDPRLLLAACRNRFRWDAFSSEIQQIAKTVLSDKSTPPFSSIRHQDTQHLQFPKFGSEQASQVAAAICAAKLAANPNELVVGRKIGFTNTNIWPVYNVTQPTWGYLWGSSVSELTASSICMLASDDLKLEPKIEPELVLGIRCPPSSSMTDEELLYCIEWVAPGFEIVQSIFPSWRFTIADTTAAGGLHKSLYIGPKSDRSAWEQQGAQFAHNLRNFEIDIYCQNKLVDSGRGSNVLGGPLDAIRHLCKVLESQDLHPSVLQGEVITTGTLTKALDLDRTATWHTQMRGLGLPTDGIKLEVKVNSPLRDVLASKL